MSDFRIDHVPIVLPSEHDSEGIDLLIALFLDITVDFTRDDELPKVFKRFVSKQFSKLLS